MSKILSFYHNDLTAFGSVVYPPGDTYHVERQPAYQLVFIHTGSAALRFAGTSHFVKSGHGFMMVPDTEYSIAFSRTRKTHHTWVNYYRARYSGRIREQLLTGPPAFPIEPAMENGINALAAYSRVQDPALNMAFTLQSSALMELYMARTRQRTGSAGQVHEAVSLARQFIQEHLGEEIRLGDIARAAHVAPEYLVRLFKTAGQPSPVEYLWRRRVHTAVELIRSSGLGLQEIGQQCGFKNPYHFSRKVKEVTGISPRGHR